MSEAQRPKLTDRRELLKRLSEGKRVLHLGCTNHPYTESGLREGDLLHLELARVASDIVGIDNSIPGLQLLEAAGYRNLKVCDLERLDALAPGELGHFDLIVAGEVIEHLTNPGALLRHVQGLMGPSTELVITTINAYSGMRFLQYALRGRGGVNEPVHPDHVAYYSFRTLKLAVERAGLQISEFYFYDLGPEHRPSNRWFLNLANDLCVAVSRHLADGVIAVCKLRK